MISVLAAAEQVREAGRPFAPAGDGAIALIDPRDVGAVAAAVLTSDGHDGRTYELTGPEALTYRDIAEALSAAGGRRIEYVDVPAHAAHESLVAAGMPPWLIEHLDGAYELVRRGELAHTTDAVRMLTGRDPRTFAAFARDHAGLFAADVARAALTG
ncbi:MAG TPA: hypothetical protein VH834_25495 [Solirubrobacteraceae bacterium]|jgi:uncharacterized protein YbjT (DUF2867 family)